MNCVSNLVLNELTAASSLNTQTGGVLTLSAATNIAPYSAKTRLSNALFSILQSWDIERLMGEPLSLIWTRRPDKYSIKPTFEFGCAETADTDASNIRTACLVLLLIKLIHNLSHVIDKAFHILIVFNKRDFFSDRFIDRAGSFA